MKRRLTHRSVLNTLKALPGVDYVMVERHLSQGDLEGYLEAFSVYMRFSDGEVSHVFYFDPQAPKCFDDVVSVGIDFHGKWRDK